ncbi:hypothetical protein QBC46DRAFT_339095 [Diplogelasinospora grovesii]|uniref:Uncharacterized protein n=1 Tax=Diplogelasinospora grovesii TaxID=303347 RepID=A0AAN6S6F2_9PEZI|nr:hypothetical protein QBC46DRAFT_339095 [Diplogelasinospora grovesii]
MGLFHSGQRGVDAKHALQLFPAAPTLWIINEQIYEDLDKQLQAGQAYSTDGVMEAGPAATPAPESDGSGGYREVCLASPESQDWTKSQPYQGAELCLCVPWRRRYRVPSIIPYSESAAYRNRVHREA